MHTLEAKVTAQQNALKAENDLTRIKVEAEPKVAQAQAEAKALEVQNSRSRRSCCSLERSK
jgi:prohibitin 2